MDYGQTRLTADLHRDTRNQIADENDLARPTIRATSLFSTFHYFVV